MVVTAGAGKGAVGAAEQPIKMAVSRMTVNKMNDFVKQTVFFAGYSNILLSSFTKDTLG